MANYSDYFLKSYQKKINYYIDNIENDLNKISNKYLKLAEDEYKYICRSVIDAWYESYEPNPEFGYDRYGTLYDAFHINVNKKTYSISVDFDSDMMADVHRVNNDYIFENSFVKGFHGGAMSGKDHPKRSTPYWRKPPKFQTWGNPAIRTFSPYYMIVNRINKKNKVLNYNFNQEIIAYGENMVRDLKKTMSRLYKKG